tara:strand:+ start:24 stop:602 length:579 start_codon:yes stop_codon:yes gene_type:complete
MITQKLIHQSIQNVEYARRMKERRQRKIKYEEWKHKTAASYYDFVLNPIEYIEADMGCRFDGKLKDIPEGWSWWTKGKNCIKYRDFYSKAKFIEGVNSRDTELIFKACTKRGLKDLRDVCLSRLSKEEQEKFRFKAQDNCNWRGWVHKVTKDDLVKSLMEIRSYLISKTWILPKPTKKTKSKRKAWKNNYIL